MRVMIAAVSDPPHFPMDPSRLAWRKARSAARVTSQSYKNEAKNMIAEWRGKWALITGASAGIGVALAKELAATGTNLVLTARRKQRLEELAASLTERHKIKTLVLAADLVESDAPEKIHGFTTKHGIEIDLL